MDVSCDGYTTCSGALVRTSRRPLSLPCTALVLAATATLGLALLSQAVPAGAAVPAPHGPSVQARTASAGLPSDVHRACALPSRPRQVTCMALVRTNTRVRPLGIQALATPPSGYGPADLQSAYNMASASASAGTGEVVAIVDAYNDPNAEADLAAYRAQYGLPPCTTANGCFAQLNQQGQAGPLPVTSLGWAEEESLDLDMVSAICPNCHIDLIEANSNFVSDLGTAENSAVGVVHAAFVSDSWGTTAPLSDAQYGSYFNHPGTVITVSGGDFGYRPSYPAASQFVTAVGGTILVRARGGGWAESVWGSASGGEGTGSGCTVNGKPSWQTDTGCAQRTSNDVAAVADPDTGVAVYDSQPCCGLPAGWQVLGGTSAASPIIAATYALAGLPAARTYPSMYPYLHSASLYDVTSGADGTCTPAYLCTAEPGYDGPTGLGTPDGTGAFALGPTTGNIVTLLNPGTQVSAVSTMITPLQLQAIDTDSAQTLTYAATGLPAGLTLNPATGVISGTPTAPGVSHVTVTATDGTGAANTVSLTWTAKDVITIQQPPATYSTLGVPASLQIQASDSVASQQLTYSATGLPPGLTINPATGLISGTPTAFGQYAPVVTVTDSSTSASAYFVWYVHGSLTVTAPGPLPATVGDLVNAQVPVTDTDSAATIGYSLTGLPPDLTNAGGLIYGWLASPGTYHVTAFAEDSVGATGTVSFTWTVGTAPDSGPTGPVRLDIGSTCLAAGLVRNGERRAVIRRCDRSADQRWTVVKDNTLRLNGQCLGTAGNRTAAGTPVVIGPCQVGSAWQWELGQDAQVVGKKSGLCLTDPGSRTGDGTGLVIATCHLGHNQRWTEPAGQLISWAAGQCLAYGATGSVRTVSVLPCSTTASQDWTVAPDGTIRAAGMCLTNPTGTAGPVDLQSCTGAAGQSWQPVYPYETDGWQLTGDGLCLDSPLGSVGQVEAEYCGSPQFVGDSQTWLVR